MYKQSLIEHLDTILSAELNIARARCLVDVINDEHTCTMQNGTISPTAVFITYPKLQILVDVVQILLLQAEDALKIAARFENGVENNE